MLAGHVKGSKTSLSSMFEAVGANAAGKMSLEEGLNEYECKELVQHVVHVQVCTQLTQ